MRICAVTGVILLAGILSFGQTPAAPPAADHSQATITTAAEEVVLDLIVRDKKGRPIKDLTPDEVEITDGGQPGRITSMRWTEVGQADETTVSKKYDPMRQLRLVTLLFDSLKVEPAIQAKAAAHELIKAGAGPNVYFSILRMAGRLQAMQEFTNDGAALNKAIDQIVGSRINLNSHAESLENRLRSMAGGDATAQDQLMGGNLSGLAGGTDSNGKPLNPTAVPMARLLLNIITTATIDAHEIQSRPILGALRAAADQQKDLPGRKTIVYFTEGWNLTYALKDQFQALISAANRANVSFYIVDASGLVIGARNESARRLLNQSISAGPNENGGVSFEQARSEDTRLESMNANTQTALMDLSGSTGGTFISDSNDLRKPMQKLVEDVNSYYEVNYVPAERKLDAHFREIKVKVKRPGVKVQARSGYFDLPNGANSVKGSWELTALKELESAEPAKTFAFEAKPFVLRRTPQVVTGELVYRIPNSALEFEENGTNKTFRFRFGAMALFRDSTGKVVQKLSREVGQEGALDSISRAKAAHSTVTQAFRLAPGAYSVEIAIVDSVGAKSSALKTPFVVASGSNGIDLGGPYVVERLDPLPQSAIDPTDPLIYGQSRVLPSLLPADSMVIDPQKQSGLPLYFLIRCSAANQTKPEFVIDIVRDGAPFTSVKMPLAEANAAGEIPVVATIPSASLGGGKFELVARLKQGDETAERKMDFTITGEPRVLQAAVRASGKPDPIGGTEAEADMPLPAIVAAPLHPDLKPPPEEIALLLDAARQRAKDYTSSLPNFVCLQVTRRLEQPVSKPPKEDWRELDGMTEQLAYVDGHEKYSKVGGVQRGNDMGRGVLSNGEFGTMLRMIFRPESKADFQWHDLEITGGGKTHVFEYSIERANSEYMIRPNYNSPATPVAARGIVAIDDATHEIRRITLSADKLPKKFPFQESTISVEYESTPIGDQIFLLPRRASVRVTAGKKINRNEIEYLNYRKWAGSSELKFDNNAPPPPTPKKN